MRRVCSLQHLHKGFRKAYVLHAKGIGKQRSNLLVPESGNPAADARYIEEKFLMRLGEGYELCHIRLYGFHSALHRRDGVALTLQANALTHDGAELPPGHPRGTAAVGTMEVRPKDEDFILLQFCDIVRRKNWTLNSVVGSHN